MDIWSGNCKQGGWDTGQASAMRSTSQVVACVARCRSGDCYEISASQVIAMKFVPVRQLHK